MALVPSLVPRPKDLAGMGTSGKPDKSVMNNMELVESNRSSNAEIIAQIHLWIFEHSLKYNMKNVIKSKYMLLNT